MIIALGEAFLQPCFRGSSSRGPHIPRAAHETGSPQGRCPSEMSHLRQQEFGFELVAEYRLYGLDGVRKVASGEWIEADDDETAIEVATEKFGGRICEVWQGLRMVARIDLREHD